MHIWSFFPPPVSCHVCFLSGGSMEWWWEPTHYSGCVCSNNKTRGMCEVLNSVPSRCPALHLLPLWQYAAWPSFSNKPRQESVEGMWTHPPDAAKEWTEAEIDTRLKPISVLQWLTCADAAGEKGHPGSPFKHSTESAWDVSDEGEGEEGLETFKEEGWLSIV